MKKLIGGAIIAIALGGLIIAGKIATKNLSKDLDKLF